MASRPMVGLRNWYSVSPVTWPASKGKYAVNKLICRSSHSRIASTKRQNANRDLLPSAHGKFVETFSISRNLRDKDDFLNGQVECAS
jgi:hypothetical protein